MRNTIIKSVIGLTCLAGMTSCGDKFLETDYFNGVDVEGALTTPTVIGYALNGTYYRLQQYYFAGNYCFSLGDIASDLTYWTGRNAHQNQLYQFTYTENDITLYYVWDYGYKVVDNAARIVEACEELIPEAEGYDLYDLKMYEAEARCLRAYANLYLVNIFAHQVRVDGKDFSNQPGLVIVDKPIEPFTELKRSTVGETYNFILQDLKKAIDLFEDSYDQATMEYMSEAAAYALLARTHMYLENWKEAAEAAETAIALSGIDTLTYSVSGYYALYSGQYTDNECIFSLAIDSATNWSANSLGTLFTTYGFSCSPYLVSLYGENDCRLPLISEFSDLPEPDDIEEGNSIEDYWYDDNYVGGKFYFGYRNTAYANNFLLCAPEQYLIAAEAYAHLSKTQEAQEALLVVAKRNNAITEVSDLPASPDAILDFLKEERARELFQEGLRFYDLRRWGGKANLYAVGAPAISWMIKDANVGDIVLPIPADEINTNYGVTQNEGWFNTQPK